MNNKQINVTNDAIVKDDDIMPTIELVEKERLSYIDEMEQYLENLKTMPKEKAVELSKKNLIESGIIDENCELTEHYRLER